MISPFGPLQPRLNLNEASADEIVALDIPDIKQKTAEKIVEGRKRRGGTFNALEDLLDIPGIGKATVAKLQASGKKNQKAAKSEKSSKFDRAAHEQQPVQDTTNAASDKEATKQIEKQAEADRKRLEEEQKAAKRQAAIDKAAAESADKRAAEQAKKQAEIDKKQAEAEKKNEKAVADAQAKLKAAQAAYEAEVARSKKQQ